MSFLQQLKQQANQLQNQRGTEVRQLEALDQQGQSHPGVRRRHHFQGCIA